MLLRACKLHLKKEKKERKKLNLAQVSEVLLVPRDFAYLSYPPLAHIGSKPF